MLEIMINGEHVKPENATVSVLDRGFLYGESVYEVIRAKAGKLFAPIIHMQRLRYSAAGVGIEIPWDDDFLLAEFEEMIKILDLPDCAIRLMITRGPGELSLSQEEKSMPTRVLYGKELIRPEESCYRDGVALAISSIRKNPAQHSKGALKTGNYLDNILALEQARQQNCHEALLLNNEDHVTECTTSNIFWVSGTELYTPSPRAGVLMGVTRQLVLYLAQQQKIKVHEGHFPLSQLLRADEIFITSTSRDILPVSKVGDHTYEVGPITQRLIADFPTIGDLEIEF